VVASLKHGISTAILAPEKCSERLTDVSSLTSKSAPLYRPLARSRCSEMIFIYISRMDMRFALAQPKLLS
jgi:hypothetical protein